MAQKEKKQDIKDKYYEAVGRRKEAVARIRIWEDKSAEMSVNDRSLEEYFPVKEHQTIAGQSLTDAPTEQKFRVSALVKGGGVSAQAEAVRHGIARALEIYDRNLRTTLKKAGYLKRDPRSKERKKFGKKKARKSPQWSKR